MENKMLLFLDFSGGELFLIGLVFLMFFGSKSIPGVARSFGKIMREFKDASNDVKREIEESVSMKNDDAVSLNNRKESYKQLPGKEQKTSMNEEQ
jgi:sec-independent protein translocase protein TatA